MEQPKIISKAEVVSKMQDDIQLAVQTLDELMPQIGHSEAKRLFLAATKYPVEHADFSGESEAMIKAYSASKNVKDALVALGVEVVIEQMIKQQQQGDVPVSEDDIEDYADPRELAEQQENTEQETKAAPKKRKTKE